jgi:hypothetical protein
VFDEGRVGWRRQGNARIGDGVPVKRFVIATMTMSMAIALACTTETTEEPAGPASCVSSSSTRACSVLPGEFPPADCDPAQETDPKKCGGGGCSIDDSKCGATSTCLPLGDNGGRSVLDFRIRRLIFAAPEALANVEFSQKVTTPSMDLKSPECGEGGFDSWPWLLRFDRNKKTLTTGGAPPSTDPFKLGYCFFNSKKNGLTIGPASGLPVRYDEAKRTFSSGASVERLLMPIFVRGDLRNMIVLPITDFAVRNVALSDDDNCIGAFNPRALDSACKETPSACSKWKTAGAMAGHITLEEADEIDIPSLGQSLCALLAKAPSGKCPRDPKGKIDVQGDYCTGTRKACDCRDSFWLAATFAASAVRIHDGSSVPECGEP